jgi:hypothetical protein
VQSWEKLVDDGLRVGRDVDQQLAAIFWVRQPSNEAALLEAIEQ